MAFSTKAWQQWPDLSTPLDADALIDLETRLGEYATGGRAIVVPYTVPGDLTTHTGVAPFIVPAAGTIESVIAAVETSPTAQPVIVDVNKNGTSIFTNQANRPSIPATNPAGRSQSTIAELADVRSLAVGDVLTVDVDQIGTDETLVPIAFGGADTDSTTGPGGLTNSITRPAGISAGQYMLLIIRCRSVGVISAPGGVGWTKLGQVDYDGGGSSTAIFGRFDTGSGGPWTFSNTISPTSWVWARIWYSNVYTDAAVDVSTHLAHASGAVWTIPELTTTVTNTMVVASAEVSALRSASALPAHSSRLGFDGAAQRVEHFADKAAAAAGLLGTETTNLVSGATTGTVHRVGLRSVPLQATRPGSNLSVVVRYLED